MALKTIAHQMFCLFIRGCEANGFKGNRNCFSVS